MKEGKIIEGLSLSFAAGIAAGTVLCRALPPPAVYPLSAIAAAVLVAAIFGRGGRRSPTGWAALFLLTGLFCAAAWQLPGAAWRWELPARAAQRLRGHIASLPFRHDGTGALVSALVTGDRSGLGAGTVRIFRDSGASHLLALSGLHVGVLYVVVERLTGWVGGAPRLRRIRAAVMVPLAGFYTVMTGASPSLVRAFLFIVINELCALTGRSRQPGKLLCLALTVQLALRPAVILSSGFQLSYLAMTGILLLYPRLARWWPDDGRWRFQPLRRIWKAAALAISCQLFTGPLAWWRFGTFPTHFLITNLLAVPLTGLLLVAALLTLLAGAPDWGLVVVDTLATTLSGLLSVIAGM